MLAPALLLPKVLEIAERAGVVIMRALRGGHHRDHQGRLLAGDGSRRGRRGDHPGGACAS